MTGETKRQSDSPAVSGAADRPFAADDAIFTCDVGTPTVWAARYLKMNGRRRLIGSFNHGSMANAMPQAIGAMATAPDRRGGDVRRRRFQHVNGRLPLAGANEAAGKIIILTIASSASWQWK